MADTKRPPSKPVTTLGQPNDARVDGYSITPAEGLDTNEISKVPMRPEEVLTLLKARLALDHDDRHAVLAGAIPHEATTSATTAWPPVSGVRGKVPSYPDITPSPIVIGLADDEEALRSYIDAAAAACGSTQDWREPAAKDTPAEPIASVRVRQASHADDTSNRITANIEGASAALAGASAKESISERLYFPPMKPPESWQGDRAHEPLVQVVPDCDAKTRTARSLRRPSSRPAPPAALETHGWRWALLLSGAALAVVLTVVLLVAPAIRPSEPVLAGVPANSALQLLTSEPAPAPLRATSSALDSGVISRVANEEHSVPKLLAPPTLAPPSQSARQNISKRSDAPKMQPAQKSQPVSQDGNRVKPQSPGNDGLVF